MISYLTLRLGVLKAKAQQQWKVDLVTNQHWYDDSKAGKRGGSRRGSSCQDKIRWQEQQLHSQLKSTIDVFILTVIYLFKIYLSSISAGYCAVVAVPVLDQWQRSIHKHGLPAAFGTSHTGLPDSARMTQLPGSQATTQEKQLNSSWRATLVLTVFLQGHKHIFSLHFPGSELGIFPHQDMMTKV